MDVVATLLLLHPPSFEINYRIEKITLNFTQTIISIAFDIWLGLDTFDDLKPLVPTDRVRVDDDLADGHAGVEPVLEHGGPPGGGAPDDEPPPSEVLATLTITRILLLRFHCWFNFLLHLLGY